MVTTTQEAIDITAAFMQIEHCSKVFDNMLINKGYISVDGHFSIYAFEGRAMCYYNIFYIKPYDFMWPEETRKANTRSIVVGKLANESILQFYGRVFAAVLAYPDAADEERKNVQKKLAELIEQVREANLDVSFVNPLTTMAEALSKNALTFQPFEEQQQQEQQSAGHIDSPDMTQQLQNLQS